MKELGAIGRAIAPEVLTAWLAALRADLRRAVRNILRFEGSEGMADESRCPSLMMSW
jgi:hypothetical protein